MESRSAEPTAISRLTATALAFCLLACGATSLSLLSIGAAKWQDWGSRIRKRDDVTVARIARLRHGLAFVGVCGAGGGALIFLRRRQAADFLDALWVESTRFPANLVRACRRLERTTAISAAAILCFGVGIRFWFLNVPMDYDEAYTFLNFARRPVIEAISDYNTTNNHLLNTFCMHWCYRLFGQQDWALRLAVLLAGIGVVAMSGIWAGDRWGARVGVTTMALVAGSPLLIYYSTNARGYMFLTGAALTFDLCARHIGRGGRWSRLAMSASVGAVALGLWAMPNMLYAIAAVSLASAPLAMKSSSRPHFGRIVVVTAIGVLLALILYLPAYIFRGGLAFEHPFVQPLPVATWIEKTPVVWTEAVVSWCQGPFAFSRPWLTATELNWRNPFDELADVTVWCLVVVAGCVFACFQVRRNVWWSIAWPLGTLAVMAVQRVAPPVRLFLFLAPWFYALVAVGLIGLFSRFHLARASRLVALASYLTLSGWYLATLPVAYDPGERSVVISAPDAIEFIARADSKAGITPSTAYVPLPCDVPMLYYAARRGLSLEVTQPVRAEPTTSRWLITRVQDSPARTFSRGAFGNFSLPYRDDDSKYRHWKKFADLQSLSIWRYEDGDH